MTAERPRHSWTCRPSLFISRMLGFALAMLIALIAVFLFFRETEILWVVLAVPVALWVGFKGGPMLLRLLERAGLFGRVRIEDDRLRTGRSAAAVRLDDAFEVDARLQTSTVEREYNLRHMGVTRVNAHRTHTLRVSVLSVMIEQDGRRYQLVGDETDRTPGPAYETDGLAVRPLPVVKAPAAQVRLWGADLVELLRQLRDAQGYSTPALGEQPAALEDPRTAFCPPWKVAVGAVAILCVFAVGSLAAFQDHQERAYAEAAVIRSHAEAQRKEQETLGRSLLGRRVTVQAQGGARLIGTVEGHRVQSDTSYDPYRVTWNAYVTVRVEERVDAEGRVLADVATVTFAFADHRVRTGDEVEERAADLLAVSSKAPGPE